MTGSEATRKEAIVQEKPLGHQRRLDGNYILALDGVAAAAATDSDHPRVLEEKNPRETNARWRFLFADVPSGCQSEPSVPGSSSSEDRPVLVRDNDGTLRTATLAERKMHFRLHPVKDTQRLPQQSTQEWWDLE